MAHIYTPFVDHGSQESRGCYRRIYNNFALLNIYSSAINADVYVLDPPFQTCISKNLFPGFPDDFPFGSNPIL